MATFIPAHGEPFHVFPPAGRTAFTLQELQHYVGGYLETVATGRIITPDGRLCVLFVNEDGKRGPYTPNAFATALVRAYLQPDDVIAGDAILCTLAEAGEGEDADG